MIASEWLPADWHVVRRTDTGGNEHVTVYRPDQTAGMSMGEAIVLRDILTTRSRSVDRDVKAARP